VREHQFIAATDNLDYTFERVKGIRNMLLGGSGFFIDKFRATEGDALVWLHGHGNVFQVELGPGEQLDVEAGGWLFKDPTVKLEAVSMGLKTGMFGGGGKLTWNRFTALAGWRSRRCSSHRSRGWRAPPRLPPPAASPARCCAACPSGNAPFSPPRPGYSWSDHRARGGRCEGRRGRRLQRKTN